MKNLKITPLLILLSFFAFSCEKGYISTENTSTAPTELKNSGLSYQTYIVSYRDGVIEDLDDKNFKVRKLKVTEHTEALFKKKKIKTKAFKHVYGKALKGFAMELSEEEALLLKEDKDVLNVEPDQIVTLSPPIIKGKPDSGEPATQITPWGINRVGGSTSGVGKTAWIIDSGIDLDHPDLNVDITRAAVFLGSKDTPDDQNGHGTHVAGTVAALDNSVGVIGVAPGATVVPVRVLNRRGSGTTSGVIAGVDYVAANASSSDVANMSLGGGISTTLDLAVLNASATCKFVLAAGNESDDADNHSPARINGSNIFTISAMNINDNWAYFSNYGSAVDYCAPGYSIESTYKNGGYSTLSGTSMAAPHVCGLLLISNNLNTDGYVNGDPDGNPDPIAHN